MFCAYLESRLGVSFKVIESYANVRNGRGVLHDILYIDGDGRLDSRKYGASRNLVGQNISLIQEKRTYSGTNLLILAHLCI